MEMLVSELQYCSPGRQVYYWFGSAYAIIRNGSKTYLKYIATEAKVKEALANGIKSRRPWVNEVLKRERQHCHLNPKGKDNAE